MSVQISADDTARQGTITLTSPGAPPTTIDLRGAPSRFNVPMLMLTGETQRISWSLDGSPPTAIPVPLVATNSVATSSIAGNDVYSPTLAWNPGASKRVRRMSILGATLISIALLACPLLLRGRKAVIGAAVVVTVSTAAIAIAQGYLSPIWRAEGQIVVMNTDGTAQLDTWRYLTTRSPEETSIELPDGARPMFVDHQHARDLQASLHFDAARNILSLRVKLQPEMKIAVLHRRTMDAAQRPTSTEPIARPLKSPMGELARLMYVDRDTRIVDEGSVEWIDDQLVHWASIILWRDGT